MAVALNLEGLLLRPQATEASYRYIESLVVKRIEDGTLFSNQSVDSTADVIDLLSSCLYRAGSGWLQVVATRLSKKVIIPALAQVHEFNSKSVEDVLSALNRMLTAYPVLIRCCRDSLLKELQRIMTIPGIPCASALDLTATVIEHTEPSQEFIQLAAGKAVCYANVAKDRSMVQSSLCVLSALMDFVVRDAQILNTVLATVSTAMSLYGEDANIRRLCRTIEDFGVDRESQGIEESTHAIADLESKKKETIEITEEAPLRTQIVGAPPVDSLSPRSSCPSLDL